MGFNSAFKGLMLYTVIIMCYNNSFTVVLIIWKDNK